MIVSPRCFPLLLPLVLPVMAHKLGFNFLITHGKQMKIYCSHCCLNVCASAGRPRSTKVGRTSYPSPPGKNIYANRQQAAPGMAEGMAMDGYGYGYGYVRAPPWFAFGRISAIGRLYDRVAKCFGVAAASRSRVRGRSRGSMQQSCCCSWL